MNSPSEAVNAYRGKGILIDANLLLLLFVGLHSRKRIGQFKRTAQFTPEDFDCLMSIIPRFTQIITTPSILTEVSNMLGQFTGHDRALVFSRFSLGLRQLQEHFTSSSEVSQEPCFLKFGLTDAGIVRAA